MFKLTENIGIGAVSLFGYKQRIRYGWYEERLFSLFFVFPWRRGYILRHRIA